MQVRLQGRYDGHERNRGSKLHMVVDPLGHLLTLTVTPAGEQERAQGSESLTEVQAGHERLPTTVAGLHYPAFASLMLSEAARLFGRS